MHCALLFLFYFFSRSLRILWTASASANGGGKKKSGGAGHEGKEISHRSENYSKADRQTAACLSARTAFPTLMAQHRQLVVLRDTYRDSMELMRITVILKKQAGV